MSYRHSLTCTVVLEGPTHAEFCAGQNWVYMWSTMYMYTRESSWNPNLNTLEPDRSQHDCFSTCVITQQYSSTTFFSSHFYSHKGKFGTCLKNVSILVFFYFFKIAEVWNRVTLNCRRRGLSVLIWMFWMNWVLVGSYVCLWLWWSGL
jgi:hypothetical protein